MPARFLDRFCSSLVCAFALCLLVTACTSTTPSELNRNTTVATPVTAVTQQDISKARVVTCKNIRILHLYGSPAQMGEQQGRLLKADIDYLITHYLNSLIGPDARIISLHAAHTFFEPHIPDDYIREMHALATAAKIDYDTVLLAQCFLDLSRFVACSTVALGPTQNALNEPMLLRNLDFPSLGLAEKYSMLIIRHPQQGPETVSIGWPLLIGTLSGFNQDGFALAMMESYGKKSAVKGMPYSLRFRHCLEHCSTKAAARSYFKDVAITAANNLTCIDRSGDAAVFELSNAQSAVRNADQQPIYACNNFVSPELHTPSLDSRYPRLERYFSDYDHHLDLPAAEKLLARVAVRSMNLQAFVILPASQRLHISLGTLPACDGPYVTLDAKDMDLQPFRHK